jgi:hypothetical protein
MATYGYSTPYTGRGDMGPLPPGFMEAATAPGRNLAMGIAAMGQGLGKAIEQYRTKKAETEAATQSWETVSGLMQQQLASDPKYLAIQQYMETGALPQGVTEQDIPRYTQQVQADREMLNKFSALGEKFPDMSLAKKKAALGDAVMVLNQYRTDQQNQVREALTQQQLALGALQLQQAQREAAAAPYFTQALGEVMSRPQGQGPTAPYANVTSELIDKYGDKLTPAQMQALIPMLRKSEQVLPPGLVPTEAKMTPSGLETTYGVPPTVGSQPIPGTDMVQPTVGGKPYGTAQPAKPLIQSKIDELPKEKQEWANSTLSKLREFKSFSELEARANEYSTLEKIASKPNPSPADDIALIIRFNKTMDPAGAVLEGEFKRSVEGGSVAERVKQYYEYYTAGNRLTTQMRKDIVDAARSVVESYAPSAAGRINDEVKAAEYRGVPKEAVIPDSMIKFWEKTSATSGEDRKTSGGVNYRVKRN